MATPTGPAQQYQLPALHIAWDTETAKWLAGILLAAYFLLLLYGLFQYQARNRSWGIGLVLGATLWLIVAGVLLQQGWHRRSTALVACMPFAWLAWRLGGSCRSGWQHPARTVLVALVAGPAVVLAGGKVEWGTALSFVQWLQMRHGGSQVPWPGNGPGFWALYLLPGLLWVGLTAGLCSWLRDRLGRPGWVGWESLWRTGRRRAALAAVGCVWVLGLNWFLAGCVGPHRAAEAGWRAGVLHVSLSRPGSAALRDFVGCTPLYNAARSGRADVVRLLLWAGSPVHALDAYHGTPLHEARSREVVEALLAAGLDVQSKTGGPFSSPEYSGVTPLHRAAGSHVADVVGVLLDAGAQVNARDGAGQTPVDLATERTWPPLDDAGAAQRDTLALLRQHGGKTGAELDAEKKAADAKDAIGGTPPAGK